MRTHFLQVIFFGFFLILPPSHGMVDEDDDGDPTPAAPVSSSTSSSTSSSSSSSNASTSQKGSRIRRARALTVQLGQECVGLLQVKIAEWAKKPIRRRELPSTTAETPSPAKAHASPRNVLPSPRTQSSPQGRVEAPNEYYKWRSSPNLKSSSERSSLRDSPAFTPIPLYPPRQIPTDKELAEFQAEYKRRQDEHKQAKEAYKILKSHIEATTKEAEAANTGAAREAEANKEAGVEKRAEATKGDEATKEDETLNKNEILKKEAKAETEKDNTLQSSSTSSASPLSYFTLMKALTRVNEAAASERKHVNDFKKVYAVRKNRKGEIVIDNGFLTPRSAKSPSELTLERALESPN